MYEVCIYILIMYIYIFVEYPFLRPPGQVTFGDTLAAGANPSSKIQQASPWEKTELGLSYLRTSPGIAGSPIPDKGVVHTRAHNTKGHSPFGLVASSRVHRVCMRSMLSHGV